MEDLALPDVADPTDFELSELQAVDSVIRCPMCKEFFEGPVLLSQCGHTFCSLCIRGYLPSKSECPVCRHSTSESSLVRNSTLEDIIYAYQAARPVLLSILKENSDLKHRMYTYERKGGQFDVDATPHNPKKRKRIDMGDGVPDSDLLSDDKDCRNGPSKGCSTPAPVSKSRRMLSPAAHDLPLRSDTGRSGNVKVIVSDSEGQHVSGLDPLVSCPICGATLRNSLVNPHIDRGCADPSTKQKEIQAWGDVFGGSAVSSKSNGKDKGKVKKKEVMDEAGAMEPRVPIPKVTWHLTKEKTVREMLSEHGLSIDGDKNTMIARFNKWIALYNSSIDTSHPKPLSRLRQELREWEHTRQEDMSERKNREKKIKDTATYLASNAPQFAALTAQVKARVKEKPRADGLEDFGPTRATVPKPDLLRQLTSPSTSAPPSPMSSRKPRGAPPTVDHNVILISDD